MKAQQLKNSILQLAVQGKLVPQNPNDEPASVLLERIRDEKQRLIEEGEIKKEKPLLPIKEDEIPFDVLEAWEWVRLGTLINKLTDGAYHTPKYTESGVPFLSVKDCQEALKIDPHQRLKVSHFGRQKFRLLAKYYTLFYAQWDVFWGGTSVLFL